MESIGTDILFFMVNSSVFSAFASSNNFFCVIKSSLNSISNFSLSLDIPLKEKKNKLIKDLNYFVKKNNLIVNLSKDIVLDEINLKTLEKNKIFNKSNSKFINKNSSSKLFERLKT